MPIGIDVHKNVPMVVFASVFQFWPRDWTKDTETVMADGWDMIQDGFSLFLVPHIPTIPDPKVAVLALLATAGSSSKPFLAKQTVSGEGTPLACCVDGPLGWNANCWDMGIKSVPSGMVICPTTVVTTPTLGDLVAALIGLVMNNVASLLGGKILDGNSPTTKVAVTWAKRLISPVIKTVKEQSGIDLGPLAPLLTPGQPTKMAKKAAQRAVDEAVADLLS
jgi:hypothetical protein